MGATPNIFCPEISKAFEYLKANSDTIVWAFDLVNSYFSYIIFETFLYYNLIFILLFYFSFI